MCELNGALPPPHPPSLHTHLINSGIHYSKQIKHVHLKRRDNLLLADMMTGGLVDTSTVIVQSSLGQHWPCTVTSLQSGGSCW